MSQAEPSIRLVVHQIHQPKSPNSLNVAKQVLHFVLRISCFEFPRVPPPSARIQGQFLKLSFHEYIKHCGPVALIANVAGQEVLYLSSPPMKTPTTGGSSLL